MTGYIYKITNKVNGKSYIGQTRFTVEFRWRQHKNAKDDYALHRAIRKWGAHNFEVNTLLKCDVSELDTWEIYYIAKYNTFKCGYNMTKGGSGRCSGIKYKGGYLETDNQFDEIAGMYQAGFSATKIAALYETDRHSIASILTQMGFKLKPNKITINSIELQEVIAKYETGYSLRELAKEYGCTGASLKDFLIKKGVDIKKRYSILTDIGAQQQLVEYYNNRTYKVSELKTMFHCSTKIFRQILNKHGVIPIGKGVTYKLTDKESLEAIKMYNDKVKVVDIANHFNVDKCTIYSLFKRYHVDY